MHSASNATHQATIGQGTPVLDHHTGRLWLFMTRNNSELLLTHTDDHGASWAPVKDMQVNQRPATPATSCTMGCVDLTHCGCTERRPDVPKTLWLDRTQLLGNPAQERAAGGVRGPLREPVDCVPSDTLLFIRNHVG